MWIVMVGFGNSMTRSYDIMVTKRDDHGTGFSNPDKGKGAKNPKRYCLYLERTVKFFDWEFITENTRNSLCLSLHGNLQHLSLPNSKPLGLTLDDSEVSWMKFWTSWTATGRMEECRMSHCSSCEPSWRMVLQRVRLLPMELLPGCLIYIL